MSFWLPPGFERKRTLSFSYLISYLERKGILSIVVSDNYEISGNGFHKTLTVSLLQICGLCLKGVCARKPRHLLGKI